MKIKEGVRKLSNFVKISTEEIAEIARILGKNDVNELSSEDLVAMNKDLGEICGVKWLGEK